MLPKTIYQYNKDNRLIRIWANSRECEKHDFDRRHVIKCCKGQRNTHKGFKWSYKKTSKVAKNDAQIYLF